MRIGILETGAPPEPLGERFGDYPAMFRRLLGPAYDYTVFDVPAGELPSAPAAFDAYLVTGSPAGVYDSLPWIAPLERFLVSAKGQAALVGVCFGHQVMAQAFGGRVEKSDKGWGVGLHTYRIEGQAPWMDPVAAISVPASHQDQVVALPRGARVMGGSDFAPFGFLAYEDQPAISIQLHPEFEPDYAKALVESRSGDRLPSDQAEAAVRSLDRPNDNARLGVWIRRFLER